MTGKVLLLLSTLVLGLQYSLLGKITTKLPTQQSYLLFIIILAFLNIIAVSIVLLIKSDQPISYYWEQILASKEIFGWMILSALSYMTYMITVSLGLFESKSGLILSIFELMIPLLVIVFSYVLFGTFKMNVYTIIAGVLMISGGVLLVVKG